MLKCSWQVNKTENINYLFLCRINQDFKYFNTKYKEKKLMKYYKKCKLSSGNYTSLAVKNMIVHCLGLIIIIIIIEKLKTTTFERDLRRRFGKTTF